MFYLRVCDHLAARDTTGGANRLHREIQIVATTIYSELLYPCCPCYAWAGSGGFAIVAFTRFRSTNPPNPRSLNLNFDRLIDCRLHVRVCMRVCVLQNMLIGLQGASGTTTVQLVPLADAPEGGLCKP